MAGPLPAALRFPTASPPDAGRLTRRTDRRANGIQWRLHRPELVWPYPWIDATGPEKLVYMELVKRHIAFKFQAFITELIPEVRGVPILDMPAYRADFALPSIKVILDPWDDYHHALNAKQDAIKLAVYQALGWKTYHVWSTELFEFGASWWFNQIPELAHAAHGAPKLYHTQKDSAGIAAANRSRRKTPSPILKRRIARGRRAS